MPLHSDAPLKPLKSLLPILKALRDLYDQMDDHYVMAANHYHFNCNGCDENCCETRFYHHTVVESIFLIEGASHLLLDVRKSVLDFAEEVIRKTKKADQAGQNIRIMCPLNKNQKCILYPYRPMICRLHGIRHEFHRNDGVVVHGEGCREFDNQSFGKTVFPFDRTPFYRQMVMIETRARKQTGIYEKIKMSIAEILTEENLILRCFE